MWVIRRDIMRDPSRQNIWIRRWALILTLFVAGVTLAADLIFLLTAFLRGDALTTAFLLKVLTVFLVAGGAFLHFIADLWGYWDANPSKKRLLVAGVSTLALVSIIAGFFIVGTPQQARLYQTDQRKVDDLSNIQWQIVNYWQQKEMLPATLADLEDPISNYLIPVDPQSGEPYVYRKTGTLSFELCAIFNRESTSFGEGGMKPTRAVGMYGEELGGNWAHGAGEVCFERTIDPERYPPFDKTR
jgi:hypothetical protein